jgi:hypothetical protein
MINQPTKSLFQSFQELSRDLGWLNASLYAFKKLLLRGLRGRASFYKYYLVAQPVRRTPLLPAGRGRTIEVRLVDASDPVVRQFPRPGAVIRERFQQGAKCLVATKDGQFIGFLWLLFDTYIEDTVRASYSPQPSAQAVWDFDVYVEPRFRVGFAFLRLWDEANRILSDRGIEWSCSRISAFNPGSLGSHARLGNRTLGTAMFFCAGRWQLTCATVAPYIHLSTQAGSLPVFRLNTDSGVRASETQIKTIGE